LTDFSILDTLDLSKNSFNGTIPGTLFNLRSIRLVYLSDNHFMGTIPANYGDAANLRDLYVDGNQLTGQIPGIVESQLQNLTEFLLQDNALTGSMPGSVCQLRTIGVLVNLWADCDPVNEKVYCPCCTQCVFQ
jgi:Leucine-rich repeat (LRR) protein